MKRILPLVYFSLSALYIHAQEVKDVNWDQVRRKYNNDSSRMVLSLNNIPLNGVYKQRFDDGGYGLYNIKNGMITGDVVWYNITGKVSARMGYKNGVRHGKKEHYDGQGKTWLKENYVDGKQDGVTQLITSGTTAIAHYKRGKREGLSTRYVSGRISSEENYKNGLKEGVSRTYVNGELNAEASYKQGVKDGMSKSYAMGQPVMEVMYKNGKKNGIFIMYANGMKTQDAYYVEDRQQGPSRIYKPDGSILFTNYFWSGQKITKAEFEKRSQ